MSDDLISRQAAIDAAMALAEARRRWETNEGNAQISGIDALMCVIEGLPSAQPEIAENLYLYRCYITDKDGLQHEVIHTGDIRRVTGWEI